MDSLVSEDQTLLLDFDIFLFVESLVLFPSNDVVLELAIMLSVELLDDLFAGISADLECFWLDLFVLAFWTLFLSSHTVVVVRLLPDHKHVLAFEIVLSTSGFLSNNCWVRWRATDTALNFLSVHFDLWEHVVDWWSGWLFKDLVGLVGMQAKRLLTEGLLLDLLFGISCILCLLELTLHQYRNHEVLALRATPCRAILKLSQRTMR